VFESAPLRGTTSAPLPATTGNSTCGFFMRRAGGRVGWRRGHTC